MSGPWDQLANGFMQFYGQDVAAGVENELNESYVPYDFTNDPDSAADESDGRTGWSAYNVPLGTNFFSYYNMGNVGFISYSGAHDYEEMLPYFRDACSFMDDVKPDAVLLLGHWNTAGLGCNNNMTVPNTFLELQALPECSAVASKMRYVMGHTHCNVVSEEDVGFMVAGQGMTSEHLPCDGNFGIPVVDTHDGLFNMYFFDVEKYEEYDHYDEILDCITTNGVSQCYHLATTWSSVPL